MKSSEEIIFFEKIFFQESKKDFRLDKFHGNFCNRKHIVSFHNNKFAN